MFISTKFKEKPNYTNSDVCMQFTDLRTKLIVREDKSEKKTVAYIMMKLTKKTLSTPVYSSLQLVQLEQFVQDAGDAVVCR